MSRKESQYLVEEEWPLYMLLPVGIWNKILFVWFYARSDLAKIGKGNYPHLYAAAKSGKKLNSGPFFMLDEPQLRQVEE